MNKSSIFFDNDPRHIEEVKDCRKILCIKVPGVTGLPNYTGYLDLTDEDFTEHLLDVSENMLNFLIWVNGQERDLFDSTSGMTKEHLVILEKWLHETTYTDKWAIFDFDRTITKIEGFSSSGNGMSMLNRRFIQENKEQNATPVTAEEYMTYLCGKSRIPLLREIFDVCKRHYVKIVILTNNGACITDPTLMIDLMRVVGVDDFELICSRRYESDKGRALHEELAYACPSLF